jgi:hypothetical protein
LGGNAGGAGNGGNGGDGGQGGGPNPICTPTEGEPIGAQCGVFVNAASVGGDGSQAMPYSTITEAVAALGGATHIYVCGGDSFSGSISLPAGVSLSGGLACADWTYAAANPTPELLGTADVAALTILGAGTSTIESFRITAPNASAPGASSIGAVIETAEVELIAVTVSAGAGQAGATGMSAPANNAAVGASGNNGANACTDPMSVDGGAGTSNNCGGMLSTGGAGGNGNTLAGGSGEMGQSGSLGVGGTGQPNIGPWSCGVGVGGGGDNGSPGSPGSPGSLKGSLTASGFVGDAGLAGSTGTPGQGGGGGGGAKGR